MSRFALELLCSVVFLLNRNSLNNRCIGTAMTAALIRGRRLLTFWSQMRRLFEGGAYSGAALIRVNTVIIKPITIFSFFCLFSIK